ncbi:hypothetical protein TWF730_003644 [Orbilia blumenaviensis]|uniref:BTB domain-containing protein n=1 Tax=Orbilia blumenaviensis TaxID=1796055 RepID=A0AAV9U3I0_9PEZI
MSLIIEWPEDPEPSHLAILKSPYPTAMESRIDSFATSIRQNMAFIKFCEPPSSTNSEATDSETSNSEHQPEEERLALLKNIISDRDYMDLVCVVGGRTRRQGFLCHRIIIGKQSPNIASTLESTNLRVQLPFEIGLPWKITANGFIRVLDWCYKRTVPTESDYFADLAQLYVAAKILEINALAGMTMEILKKKDFAFEFDLKRYCIDDIPPDIGKTLTKLNARRHVERLNVVYSVMGSDKSGRDDSILLAVKSVAAVGKTLYSKYIAKGLTHGLFTIDLQRILEVADEPN